MTGADDITSANTIRAAILSACPILLAGMGGLWSERAGVVNIGLEGQMLLGTWGAAYFTYWYGPWAGLLGRRGFGALGGLLHALATITFGVDHIVSGVAINIIGLGVTQYLAEAYFSDLQNGGPRQLTGLDPLPYVTVPGLSGGLTSVNKQHWFVISDVAGFLAALTTKVSAMTVIIAIIVALTACGLRQDRRDPGGRDPRPGGPRSRGAPAETGHLVFTTLHTRDAKGVITRHSDRFPQDATAGHRGTAGDEPASPRRASDYSPNLSGTKSDPAPGSDAWNTNPIASAIRTGKVESIDNYLLTGRGDGTRALTSRSGNCCSGRAKIQRDVAERNVRELAVLNLRSSSPPSPSSPCLSPSRTFCSATSRDLARQQQPHRLVEADHAVLPAGQQVVVDALDLAGADGAGDRVGVPQHLQGQVPLGPPLDAGQQPLADDRPQAHRQLRPHVPLHVLREQVGEAGDRPLGVAGVQGGEDQVARLGGAQRHLGRLAVADFADQDHVGVLPQPVLEAVGEGQHVRARPRAA